MKYGSVCSGVEAASLAWEPLGWEAAWFAEIEPFPSAVLKHHWPHVPNHGDMLTLPEKVANEDIPAPDVLVGGTPCQAFSVAGRRGSLEDERGALTLAFVELADAIDTVRSARGEPPAIIVWENVPGVLNTTDNAFGCFLAGLAGETEPLESPGKRWTNAGYVLGPQRAVAWRVLDAQYFGLAQRRKRVFVVASPPDWLDPGAVLFEREGVRRDTPPGRGQGEEVASTVTSCIGKNGGIPAGKDATPRNLIPTAFGQNRQSGPVETSHALRAKGGTGHGDFESETFLVQSVSGDIAHTLKADGFDGSEDGTERGIPTVSYRIAGDGYAYEEGDVSAPLTTNTDPSANAVCFDTTQITHPANRSNPQPGAPCHPLAAQAHPPAIAFQERGLAVRRLMPVECERLQGMPDGHTLIPLRTIRQFCASTPAQRRKGLYRFRYIERCSFPDDGPRYKAIGNSMAVAVMGWIGMRIKQQLGGEA